MSKKIVIILIGIFSILSLLSPHITNAQAVSIGHSPTIEYLTLKPGDTYKGIFAIWNLEQTAFRYRIYVSGFEQLEDMPGTARPLSPEEDRNNPYSAAPWFNTFDKEVDLVPQRNIEIEYTIEVPKDIALGEYNAKIFLSTDSPEEFRDGLESGTINNLGAGPNFLIKVGDEGDFNELALIQSFITDKSFYSSTPVLFMTKLINEGNTHVKPVGDITIKNFLNQEVAKINFNPSAASILRGNEATYRSEWRANREILTKDGKLAIGPMKASLLATYKNVNPGFSPISAETSFWIIPWKLILAILGGIVGLILLIKLLKKLRK